MGWTAPARSRTPGERPDEGRSEGRRGELAEDVVGVHTWLTPHRYSLPRRPSGDSKLCLELKHSVPNCVKLRRQSLL